MITNVLVEQDPLPFFIKAEDINTLPKIRWATSILIFWRPPKSNWTNSPAFFNRFAGIQPQPVVQKTEYQKALNKKIRELLGKLKGFIFNQVTVAMLFKRATQTNVLDPAEM